LIQIRRLSLKRVFLGEGELKNQDHWVTISSVEHCLVQLCLSLCKALFEYFYSSVSIELLELSSPTVPFENSRPWIVQCLRASDSSVGLHFPSEASTNSAILDDNSTPCGCRCRCQPRKKRRFPPENREVMILFRGNPLVTVLWEGLLRTSNLTDFGNQLKTTKILVVLHPKLYLYRNFSFWISRFWWAFTGPQRNKRVVNPSVIIKEIWSGLTDGHLGGLRGDSTSLLSSDYVIGSWPIFSCLCFIPPVPVMSSTIFASNITSHEATREVRLLSHSRAYDTSSPMPNSNKKESHIASICWVGEGLHCTLKSIFPFLAANGKFRHGAFLFRKEIYISTKKIANTRASSQSLTEHSTRN
jgi:hypothetical protein